MSEQICSNFIYLVTLRHSWLVLNHDIVPKSIRTNHDIVQAKSLIIHKRAIETLAKLGYIDNLEYEGSRMILGHFTEKAMDIINNEPFL